MPSTELTSLLAVWTRAETGVESRVTTCPGRPRARTGIVRSVNNKEYTMMGYCRQCGKLDRVENFENRDQQLFCCYKVKDRRMSQVFKRSRYQKDTCVFHLFHAFY